MLSLGCLEEGIPRSMVAHPAGFYRRRGYKGVEHIDCSGRIVLECGCGEKLLLLGRIGDWHREGRTAFDCRCGAKLTLGRHRADEEALGLNELLRRISSKDPDGA